jgi:hypothetical protein
MKAKVYEVVTITNKSSNIDRVVKFTMKKGGIVWTVTTRNSLAEIKSKLARYEGKRVSIEMNQGPSRHVRTAAAKFGLKVK